MTKENRLRRDRGPHRPTALPRTLLGAALAACLFLPATAGFASVLVEFPGPVPVQLLGDALVGARIDFPDLSDRLVLGAANGDLTMVRYNAASGVFATVQRVVLAGRVVALQEVRDPDGSVIELLAATRDPDRIVVVRVQRIDPFLVVGDRIDLDEDPGAIALAAADQAAVTLPGIDRVAWLARVGGRWTAVGTSDAGDRPLAVVGADLDGDQVREFVVANQGVLSRSVMVFRNGPGGWAPAGNLVLPGAPCALAAGDVDGDGRDDLAVVSADTAAAWLLADGGAGLAETGRLDLTVAADAVHLAPLPGGSWGLYPSSSVRGLLEYFGNDGGAWARRDGYYPGCRPLEVITADLNGDAVPDLVSMGGTSRVVTVMFGNPDLAYWGFPALALPGRPGGLSLGVFDGDGRNDAVVMSADRGTLGFFRGRSDGGLVVEPQVQDLFLLPGPLTAIAADGAPGPELAVHDRYAGQLRLLAYGPQGFAVTASTPLASAVRTLAAADMDDDGRQDLVVLAGTAPEVTVLYGAGDGSFPASTSFGFESLVADLVAVDLDGDRQLDLVGVDAVNRVWVARNTGARGFVVDSWINAGTGSRTLAVGDLDGDLDGDIVVAGLADETLTFLENTGTGRLERRVGSLALAGRPEGALVEDVDQDGRQDVVVNLREQGFISVVYGLPGWGFTPPVNFAAGGDVAFFATGDFNTDLVPDILTLDASLRLGLTMLNVERGLVATERGELEAACRAGELLVAVRPGAGQAWRLDLGTGARSRTLAADGLALEGDVAAEGGVWFWRGAVPGPATLRLTLGVGAEARFAVLEIDGCGGGLPTVTPVAWSRAPWPNPFNPVVTAEFSLERPGPVTASVHDLRGRLVATLLHGRRGAGVHTVRWDGMRDGRPAEAGVYLLRIVGGRTVLTGKLMLLK